MRKVISWFLRLSRPIGHHVVIHRVSDIDGFVFVIDEYHGRKPITRYAMKDVREATFRACELVSNP